MNKTIFVTGATGLLGSYLVKLLLQKGYLVYALARAKKNITARDRVLYSIRFWENSLDETCFQNLKVVEGDVTFPNLGIQPAEVLNDLVRSVDIIYHAAALVELRGDESRMELTNVIGSQNLFDFACLCQQCGQLQKINYIGTAYVVGQLCKVDFSEDMRHLNQEFNNSYEKTKYKAECLAEKYIVRGLPISIFRPSMIMGDSKEGRTSEFRLFYEPLHFFSRGLYSVFPVDKNAVINLINIDTVANAIAILGQSNEKAVYHVTSSEHLNIVNFLEMAADFFNFKLPELLDPKEFDLKMWTPVQKTLAAPFLPYFNYTNKFSSVHTQNILAQHDFYSVQIDESNLNRIFDYCNTVGFIRISQ